MINMNEEIKNNISKLEQILEYDFTNVLLLLQSILSKSYANEHPKFRKIQNNALTPFGDGLIDVFVMEKDIIEGNKTRGDLTVYKKRFVGNNNLRIIANKLKINECILWGGSEYNRGIYGDKTNSVAGYFESIIGAIYLDSDYSNTKQVFWNLIEKAKK